MAFIEMWAMDLFQVESFAKVTSPDLREERLVENEKSWSLSVCVLLDNSWRKMGIAGEGAYVQHAENNGK